MTQKYLVWVLGAVHCKPDGELILEIHRKIRILNDETLPIK